MSLFSELMKRMRVMPSWLLDSKFVTTKDGYLKPSFEFGGAPQDQVETEPYDALMYAALVDNEYADGVAADYRIVLDVDIPVYVAESSSGNKHIVFDVKVSKKTHDKVLDALVEAEILQPGYAHSGKESKFGATLRLPWVRKDKGDKTLRRIVEPKSAAPLEPQSF